MLQLCRATKDVAHESQGSDEQQQTRSALLAGFVGRKLAQVKFAFGKEKDRLAA